MKTQNPGHGCEKAECPILCRILYGQVRAAVRPFRRGVALEKIIRAVALAHEPAVRVRAGHDHGVDAAGFRAITVPAAAGAAARRERGLVLGGHRAAQALDREHAVGRDGAVVVVRVVGAAEGGGEGS